MKPEIRELDDLGSALALAPAIERAATQALAEFRDEPPPPGLARRFLERHFGAPECLVLVAEDQDTRASLGFCITAPLEDPLLLERLPLVAVLFVEPAVRHRGVARALVRRARELLAARGRPVLAARAGHNDDALISMGERWGFTRAWELMVHE